MHDRFVKIQSNLAPRKGGYTKDTDLCRGDTQSKDANKLVSFFIVLLFIQKVHERPWQGRVFVSRGILWTNSLKTFIILGHRDLDVARIYIVSRSYLLFIYILF